MSQYRSVNAPRWWAILLGLLLAVVIGADGVLAQEPTWRERRTANFAILYPDGVETIAEEYAAFVDGVYDEISAIFSYPAPTPVILRIYPTMELYERINPLAAQIPGVVAHAHTGRREISVALPQTAGQSQEQIVNNVRHELTHIIAADLSGNKLTTAFQEGIAQYVEHPGPELDAKMRFMRQVIDQGRLLPWSELNRPGVAYSDPMVSYPQSYTMVAFLIQRDGMATFRRFMEASRTSSGYRAALEAAYGVSADQLEREWRAQLDAFVDGGYRDRAMGAFDLSQAKALIARGEYEAAIADLEAMTASLSRAGDAALAAEAEALLARASDGLRAQQLATEAKDALTRGEYEAAERAATEASALLEQLEQPRRREVVETYRELAAAGIAAQENLAQAHADLQTLHVSRARERLIEAYQTFTRLGDEDRATLTRIALRRMQRTETLAAVGLTILASLVLGWNVQRRINERGQTLPFG